MATDREIALEVALISVLKAAEKEGIDLKRLLDHAADLLVRYPEKAEDREDRIAGACAEISNAHTAVLTGKRVKD